MTTQGRIDWTNDRYHRLAIWNEVKGEGSFKTFHRSLTVNFNVRVFLIELFSRRCNGTEIPKNPKNTSHNHSGNVATYTMLHACSHSVSNRLNSMVICSLHSRTHIFMNEIEKNMLPMRRRQWWWWWWWYLMMMMMKIM